MQEQTQDVLSSIMGNEFKLEVEKRDKIIKSLNDHKVSLEKDRDLIIQEIEKLSSKKNGLQDEIDSAYKNKQESFDKEKELFEQSKKATTDSLDSRELALNHYEKQNDDNIKKHLDNVSAFNRNKNEFESRKKAISDTLLDASNAHSLLFKDAVDVLNSPIEEVKNQEVSEEK